MTSIRLAVAPAEARLEYDRPTSFTVTVSNLTDRVEAYQLTVVGLNPRFVRFDPSHLSKVPGRDQSAQATLTVTIPRSARVPARTHVIGVKAQSVVDPAISRVEEVRIDFPAMVDSTVEAIPRIVAGGSRGTFRVRAVNRGSVPLPLQLVGKDEEHAVTFTFDPPQILVPPHGSVDAVARVRARRPLSGDALQRPVSFLTVDSNGQIQQGAAVFVQKPLIRKPVSRFVALAVVVATALTAFLATRDKPFELRNLEGIPGVEAEAELVNLGAEVSYDARSSETIARDAVIESSPAAGSMVMPGDVVVLVLSSGPFAAVVPELAGLTGEEAQILLRELERAGINIERRRRSSTEAPIDGVIITDPEPGGELGLGDTLVVTFSEGTKVPAVVDMTDAEAIKAITDAGLVYIFAPTPVPAETPEEAGTVAQQLPVADGTPVDPGSEVVLILRQYEEPPPTEPPATEPPATDPPSTTGGDS